MGLSQRLGKRNCSWCGLRFQKLRPLQNTCSTECALEKARADQKKKNEKLFKADTRRRKEALKTRGDWTQEAQKAFNAFIRERDKLDGCISCGRMPDNKPGGTMDCGHYLSVGAHPELRFNEDNAHRQCSYCNNQLSGNHGNYRKNLIKKIGIQKVEELEGPQPKHKTTIEDLKEIVAKYREKTRELKKCAADVTSTTSR